MKTFLLIILLLVLVVAVYFFIVGSQSKTGVAVGLVEGQLTPCGNKPNCVCSEQSTRGDHYIEPLALDDGQIMLAEQVAVALQSAGGDVVATADNYLAATFTSGFFGFVDDVEARIDAENGVLHLRSASRVGHSDFGANRKRIEAIKALLLANK